MTSYYTVFLTLKDSDAVDEFYKYPVEELPEVGEVIKVVASSATARLVLALPTSTPSSPGSVPSRSTSLAAVERRHVLPGVTAARDLGHGFDTTHGTFRTAHPVASTCVIVHVGFRPSHEARPKTTGAPLAGVTVSMQPCLYGTRDTPDSAYLSEFPPNQSSCDQPVDQVVATPGYRVPREQAPSSRLREGGGECGQPPLAASRFSVVGCQHNDGNQSRRALLVAGVPTVGRSHEGPEPVVLLGGRGPRCHP